MVFYSVYDVDKLNNQCNNIFQAMARTAPLLFLSERRGNLSTLVEVKSLERGGNNTWVDMY